MELMKKNILIYIPLKNVRWSKIRIMNVLDKISIVPNSTSTSVAWFPFSEPCFCFINLSIYWKPMFAFYKMDKMMPKMQWIVQSILYYKHMKYINENYLNLD